MFGYVIGTIAGLIAFVFWAIQLADLMQRKDDDFIGKNDKVLWFVIVFVGSAFGAFLYLVCKPPRGSTSLYGRIKGDRARFDKIEEPPTLPGP